MRRNVYLSEYENMTFRERLYIVRNNDLKINWDRHTIENPLDWSLRKIGRAGATIAALSLWVVIYWPAVWLSAIRLKTRYINKKDKTWFHPDVEVLS